MKTELALLAAIVKATIAYKIKWFVNEEGGYDYSSQARTILNCPKIYMTKINLHKQELTLTYKCEHGLTILMDDNVPLMPSILFSDYIWDCRERKLLDVLKVRIEGNMKQSIDIIQGEMIKFLNIQMGE